MVKKVLAWWYSQSGATAIEYGLVGGGIALVIASAIFLFGEDLETLYFDDLAGALDGDTTN